MVTLRQAVSAKVDQDQPEVSQNQSKVTQAILLDN